MWVLPLIQNFDNEEYALKQNGEDKAQTNAAELYESRG